MAVSTQISRLTMRASAAAVAALGVGLAIFAVTTFLTGSSRAEDVPNLVTVLSGSALLAQIAWILWRKTQRASSTFNIRQLRKELKRGVSRDLEYMRHHERGRPFNLRYAQISGLWGTNPDVGSKGTLNGVRNYFRRAQALIVSGTAGSGKTLLLRTLQKDLLDEEGDHAPLVLFLQLVEWDPDTPLNDWIERRSLRLLPSSEYQSLRDEGRLVVVLDGLDEIDPDGVGISAATRASDQLAALRMPFAVACRSDRIEQLRAVNSQIPYSSTIELEPMERSDVAVHLAVALPALPGKDEFVRGIEKGRYETLYSVLRQPLYLEFAAFGIRTDDKIQELIDSNKGDEQSVQRLLIESYLDMAVRRPKPIRLRRWLLRRRFHLGERNYSKAHVLRWLHTLAKFVTEQSGTTVNGVRLPRGLIVPHHLSMLVGERKMRFGTALLTVLLWLPLIAILFGGLFWKADSRWWWVDLVALIAVCALLTGSILMTWGVVRPIKIRLSRIRERASLDRLSAAFAVAAGLVLLGTLTLGYQFALWFGAGFFTVFGFGLALAVRPDIRLSASAIAGTVVALILAPLAATATADANSPVWAVAGAAVGSVALVAGVFAGSKFAAKDRYPEIPAGYITGENPYGRLNSDVAAAATVFILAAALMFAGTWETPPFEASTSEAVRLALAAGLAAGPGLVSVAWRRYLVVIVLTAGRLPLRLGHFLRWCYEASLMRRAGAAYQFRHDRLRRFLYDGQ